MKDNDKFTQQTTFRNLASYKSMHEGTAKNKKVEKEFQAAKTLTQARKILFGHKKGNSR